MSCWLENNCDKKNCKSFCLKQFKLDYLYKKSNLSIKQRNRLEHRCGSEDAEVFNYLKQVENNIVEFVDRGMNLYIHSKQCGNGKTSWAIKLIQAYFENIWPKCSLTCKALFINVPNFLLKLKDNISEKSEYIANIKKYIYSADIVVWDDIATKAVTEFESEHLLSMIDTRIGMGKSNIYTSNLSDSELHIALGDRLASRICNDSTNLEFYGGDKRGLAL